MLSKLTGQKHHPRQCHLWNYWIRLNTVPVETELPSDEFRHNFNSQVQGEKPEFDSICVWVRTVDSLSQISDNIFERTLICSYTVNLESCLYIETVWKWNTWEDTWLKILFFVDQKSNIRNEIHVKFCSRLKKKSRNSLLGLARPTAGLVPQTRERHE